VVCTSLAACKLGSVGQFIDLFNGQHRRLIAGFVTFAGNQCGTESTHDSGNVRTGCVDTGNFFKTAQNGVIVESTTLNNNIFSQIFGIGQFDHLK